MATVSRRTDSVEQLTVYYVAANRFDDEGLPHAVSGAPPKANRFDKVTDRTIAPVKTLEVRFPGNCFLVVEVEPEDDEWSPAHCLDVSTRCSNRTNATWEALFHYDGAS